MPSDLDTIREATARFLGPDEDVSHVTDEELKNAAAVAAEPVPAGSVVEGNNIIEYNDGHYEWWEGCGQQQRKRAFSILQMRLVNCNAVTMRYRITVRR